MTPALRFSFSLVLSLLLWLPTVPSSLSANADPAMIAVRYLVALIVARLGVGLVFRLVGGYAGEAVEEEPEAEEEPEQTSVFAGPTLVDDPAGTGRRREDQVDLEETDEEALLDAALDEAADSAALAS